MTPVRRVLVPVDLTDGSEDTLRYALAWAQLMEAELHVAHVVSHGLKVADATTALAALVSSTPIAADQLHTAVLAGWPAAEIERYATSQQIDLIVMAARGHNAIVRMALGSVAQQIVRRAACPVIVVPPDSKTPRWLGNIHSILMPTDLGDTSKAAFGYARELATMLGAALHVVHVVVPPWERQLTYLPPAGIDKRLDRLTGAWPDRASHGPRSAGDVRSAIRVGDPAAQILAHAERLDADLMVMTTHSRSVFAQMMLGGVTQQVLRKASCPVLTLSPTVCRRLLEPMPDGARDELDVSA
jgi:nucleotide-binding universal stress UspA family protein